MADELKDPLKQLLLDKMISNGYFNPKNIDPSTIQTISDLSKQEALILLRSFGDKPSVAKASGGIIDVAPNDRFTNRVTRNMDPVRLAAGGPPIKPKGTGIATSDAVLKNLAEAVNVDQRGQTRETTVRTLISGEPQSMVRRLAGKQNLFEVGMEMPNGKIRKFTVSLPKGVPTYKSGMNPDDFFKDINTYFDGVDFDKDVSIVEGGKTKSVNKASLIKTAFYKDTFGKLERDAIAGVIEGYPRDYFYETKRDLKTNKAKKVLNRNRFTDFLIDQYNYVPKNGQAAFADALDSTFKKNYPQLVGKLGGIQPGTKSIKFQYAKAILDSLIEKFGEKSKVVSDYRGKLTNFIKNKNFMQTVEPFIKALKPATPFASAVAKRATPFGYALDFPLLLAAGKAASDTLQPIIEEKVLDPASEKMVEGENMLMNLLKSKIPNFEKGGPVGMVGVPVKKDLRGKGSPSDEDLKLLEGYIKGAITEKGKGPLNDRDVEFLAMSIFNDKNYEGQFGTPTEDNVNKLIDALNMMQGSAIQQMMNTDKQITSEEVLDFMKRGLLGLAKFGRMLN